MDFVMQRRFKIRETDLIRSGGHRGRSINRRQRCGCIYQTLERERPSYCKQTKHASLLCISMWASDVMGVGLLG